MVPIANRIVTHNSCVTFKDIQEFGCDVGHRQRSEAKVSQSAIQSESSLRIIGGDLCGVRHSFSTDEFDII